jgi:hypothetical protein
MTPPRCDDFRSQIGLRLAIRHPARIAALVVQNGDIGRVHTA